MSDTPKTPSGHTLYQDGDADAPECIKDGNGQVALGLCRVCGKGEIQLSEPCTPKAAPKPEDARVQRKLAKIRDLTAKVCSLPDAACKTTALNQTVCDYLTATCAENMREVLAHMDRLQADLAAERTAHEQTRVQLAGCGVAALGYARPGTPQECKPGAYGHSGSLAQVVDLYEAYAHLRAFKDLVHRRLDEMGIPTNPDGPHSKAGCRIGDRLDVVAKRLKALDLPVAASMTLSLERDGAEPLQVQARCAVEHTGRVEGLTRALTAVLDTLDREWPQHKTWREHSPEASSLREARALLQEGT